MHLTAQEIANLDQNKADVDNVIDVLLMIYRKLKLNCGQDKALVVLSDAVMTIVGKDHIMSVMVIGRLTQRLEDS